MRILFINFFSLFNLQQKSTNNQQVIFDHFRTASNNDSVYKSENSALNTKEYLEVINLIICIFFNILEF